MTSNNRLGTMSVAKLRTLLTERDQAVLQSVHQHKFLTTRQVCSLHFWNHASYGSGIRACTRVLGRLRDHHLLYRLDRPVGGIKGGSASYVWGIDAAGDRLLRSSPERTEAKRARAFEPSVMFLAHTLAIADIRITLEEAARAKELDLLTVSTEPSNWRPFLTRAGAAQILKPDLYAITASGEFEDHWFIEVDRGTESLPTLLKKCHYYQRYYLTGIEQERHSIFPLVLWLIPHAVRRERFRGAIAADENLDTHLFRIVAPEDFKAVITEANQPVVQAAVQPLVKGGTL